MIKYFLLLLVSASLIIYLGGFSFGEKKIKKEHVPEKIRLYLQREYKDAKKIKYYIESDEDTTFYEVELIQNKEKISLSFLKDGTLYEIEKKIQFKDLPLPTQSNIETYLSKSYSKYNITDVQFVNPHLKTEYELNVKTKSESGTKFYEMFFNAEGQLLHAEEKTINPIPTLF
ncbi:MAG TPA: hypothetical protein VK750_04750 [Cytophagaceae bacterium]|jgi:hypothetical protein|nr:hypothetical protein [Cytophagaceae bacterium]